MLYFPYPNTCFGFVPLQVFRSVIINCISVSYIRSILMNFDWFWTVLEPFSSEFETPNSPKDLLVFKFYEKS